MKTLKIGRSASGNDIVIGDLTVSQQHAVITILDTKEIKIKDLNSSNGTFVNDKRIFAETTITAQDRIRVGNAPLDWLKYLNSPPKPAPPFFNGDNSAVKQRKTIGSLASNDIVLNHGNVSRNHAQLILKENGDILIADSGSTNGTFVNGQKISMQVLKKGDRVLVADKYPLDWESIFPDTQTTKSNKTLKTILVAAAAVAAVLIGFLFLPTGKMSPEKIYAKYKKSVVMIEFAYYYEVFLDGKSLGYFSEIMKDKKDNLHAVVSESLQKTKLFGGTGTGFIVSGDGKIITNRHIVAPWEYADKDEQQIKNFIQEYWERQVVETAVKRENLALLSKAGKVTVEGKMYDEYLGVYLNDTHKSQSSKISCRIIKESGKREIDIGVIQINSKTLPAGVENIVNLTNAVVNDADIVAGKSIYTIGFPAGDSFAATTQGMEANNQDGKITQLRGEYEFGHNIPIIGGASGSPVFDEYGNLIGIIHRGFSGSQGYNMAVKAKYAVELAK